MALSDLGQEGPQGPSTVRITFEFDDGSSHVLTGRRLKNWEGQVVYALTVAMQAYEQARAMQAAKEAEGDDAPTSIAGPQPLNAFRDAMKTAEDKLKKPK